MMIAYSDIKKSIVDSIAKRFGKEAVISDDPFKHVEGQAFIVKLISQDFEDFEKEVVKRSLAFDVVYFAPNKMSMHELDEIGQTLAECFLYPLPFRTRYIQPSDVTTSKVDMDFHVGFELNFYDDKVIDEHYEYAQDLTFKVVLKGKGKE